MSENLEIKMSQHGKLVGVFLKLEPAERDLIRKGAKAAGMSQRAFVVECVRKSHKALLLMGQAERDALLQELAKLHKQGQDD
jgi:uncharacterized protein (DUF1778 family)